MLLFMLPVAFLARRRSKKPANLNRYACYTAGTFTPKFMNLLCTKRLRCRSIARSSMHVGHDEKSAGVHVVATIDCVRVRVQQEQQFLVTLATRQGRRSDTTVIQHRARQDVFSFFFSSCYVNDAAFIFMNREDAVKASTTCW